MNIDITILLLAASALMMLFFIFLVLLLLGGAGGIYYRRIRLKEPRIDHAEGYGRNKKVAQFLKILGIFALIIFILLLAFASYNIIQRKWDTTAANVTFNNSQNLTKNASVPKTDSSYLTVALNNDSFNTNQSAANTTSGEKKIEFQYLDGIKEFLISYSGYVLAGFALLIILILILNKKQA